MVGQEHSLAVIDIGSNSVRLVLYRSYGGIWQRIINEKSSCRLGQGIAIEGTIQPERYQDGLDCLRRFRLLLDNVSVDHQVAIATSAVREAENGPEFVRDASRILGFEPTVLDGPDEAHYAAAGVQWAIPGADGWVCDLGGSSMEIIRVSGDGQQTPGISLPIGPIHLLDLFSGERKATKAYIDSKLRQALEGSDQLQTLCATPSRLFAVGGAWRALAQLHMREAGYPLHVIHRYSPTMGSLSPFIRKISHYSQNQAQGLDVAQAERRMSLPSAALIFRRVAKVLNVDSVEFSSTGVREGALALNLPPAVSLSPAETYLRAVQTLVYGGGRFGAIGPTMAKWVAPAYSTNLGHMQRFSPQRMTEACHLADYGWDQHPTHKKTQTYSGILNSSVLPHAHHERAQLAAIQFYRHKGGRADWAATEISQMLSAREHTAAKVLGRLIHLGMQICRAQPELLQQTALTLNSDILSVQLPRGWMPMRSNSIKSACLKLSDASGLSVRLVEADR